MVAPIPARAAVVLLLSLALLGMPWAAQAAPDDPPIGPTVTSVAPKSPSDDLMPRFSGYTFSRTDTVSLYDNATCKGSPLATGTIHNYGSSLTYYWYADVLVDAGSTTDVYANASNATGTSACSTTHQRYENTLKPVNTKITKKPAKKITTKKKRAKVRFKFKATTTKSARAAAATFRCSMDGKRERPCTSGIRYEVKPGKHTFRVTASKGGSADPTPASYKFKVVRKR